MSIFVDKHHWWIYIQLFSRTTTTHDPSRNTTPSPPALENVHLPNTRDSSGQEHQMSNPPFPKRKKKTEKKNSTIQSYSICKQVEAT